MSQPAKTSPETRNLGQKDGLSTQEERIPGPTLKDRIRKLTGDLAAEAVRDAEKAASERRPADPDTTGDSTERNKRSEQKLEEKASEPAKTQPKSPATRADGSRLDAEPLGEDDVKQIDDSTGHGKKTATESVGTASNEQLWQVVFQMLENDTRSITVRVDRVTVVGRADDDDSGEAHLDLGPYGGAEQGVSRQHAILMPNLEGLWLVDLDSTNGTWINGLYLQPGMKYRLRNGDVIDFGSLRVLVRVIGAINYSPHAEEDSGTATIVSRRKPPRAG